MVKRVDADKPQTTWVNVDLTKQQTTQMKNVYADAAQVLTAIGGMLDDGYSITLKAEPAYDCFAAYCFPNRNEPLNAGMALAARGSTPGSALRGLAFRHIYVFEGNWRVPQGAQHIDED